MVLSPIMITVIVFNLFIVREFSILQPPVILLFVSGILKILFNKNSLKLAYLIWFVNFVENFQYTL